MLSTDRSDFESQLAILFGGYPTFLTPPRTEAYWRGLQKMPLSTFVRCVDYALGESGTDKLPTVNSLWQISRHLRSVAAAPPKAVEAIHPLQRVANGAMLKLLHDKGAASDESLREIVAVKNKICSQVPPDVDPAELRDVLIAAFEKLWQPMSAERVQAHTERMFGTSP
jgi:hypothetical protein